jgi:hypothetical protein
MNLIDTKARVSWETRFRTLNVKKIVKLLDNHFVIVDNGGQFEKGKLKKWQNQKKTKS